MTKNHTFKLVRKLLVLATLCVCLGLLSTSNLTVQPVAAMRCCSECEANDSECYNLSDPWWISMCLNHNMATCWNRCDSGC